MSIYSVSFRIFDGLRIIPDKEIYTSPLFQEEQKDITFRDLETFSIAGHPWTIEFVNSSAFKRNSIYTRLSYGILIFGFFMSCLLFFMIRSVMTSRKMAVLYAQKVSKKLIKNIEELELAKDSIVKTLQDVEVQKDKFQRANMRLRLATQSAKIGVWEWDVVKNRITWDTQMYVLYGTKKEDFS